eukprot:3576382-Amphidinium_carterae.1
MSILQTFSCKSWSGAFGVAGGGNTQLHRTISLLTLLAELWEHLRPINAKKLSIDHTGLAHTST